MAPNELYAHFYSRQGHRHELRGVTIYLQNHASNWPNVFSVHKHRMGRRSRRSGDRNPIRSMGHGRSSQPPYPPVEARSHGAPSLWQKWRHRRKHQSRRGLHHSDIKGEKWEDKALANLSGKPLLIHAVENVQGVVDEVAVSVCDEERGTRYAGILKEHGLNAVGLWLTKKPKSAVPPWRLCRG